MLQQYVGIHNHTQDVHTPITTTTAPTLGNLAPWKTAAGNAIASIDKTYFFNINLVGISGIAGYYAAQAVKTVPGYIEMVSVCSAALTLNGLPVDANIMPFHTYVNLAAGPNLPLADPSITWFPKEIGHYGLNSAGTPVSAAYSAEWCFDVDNDATNALYFGVAIFGNFTTTSRVITGALSLRQVTTERSTFQPNK